MEKDRNSYGSILKALGLFGGVKIFEIIANIVRSKIMAIFLGPTGVGFYGIISSVLALLNTIFGCGLSTSGVRAVSQSISSDDGKNKDRIITILRKLIIYTGLLGGLFSFCFATQLSNISFGNEDYAWAFRLISIALIVDQIIIGKTVLMQGTFHYSLMARSSIISLFVGLITTIPFYYYWGIKGIVPLIVVNSVIRLVLTSYYAKKIPFSVVKISFKEFVNESNIMLKLGIALALSGFISQLSSYLCRIYISNVGSMEDVGLYTAGIAISTSYIGVVLTAMGTDYNPRLAAVSDNKFSFITVINRQIQLLLVLILPLICSFIVFIKEIIIVLYSNDFLPIIKMVEWIMLGMYFRALSFCFSYAIIAKAESKRFFINELICNLYTLLLSVLGYYYYKFEGIGIAYCLTYMIYFLQMFYICKKRFKYKSERLTTKVALISFIYILFLILIIKPLGYNYMRYIIGTFLVIISLYISYKLFLYMVPKESIRNFLKREK